jgi:hypothetical protein
MPLMTHDASLSMPHETKTSLPTLFPGGFNAHVQRYNAVSSKCLTNRHGTIPSAYLDSFLRGDHTILPPCVYDSQRKLMDPSIDTSLFLSCGNLTLSEVNNNLTSSNGRASFIGWTKGNSCQLTLITDYISPNRCMLLSSCLIIPRSLSCDLLRVMRSPQNM